MEAIKEIQKAAKIVRKGGVILYPTDTIWGMGCDARNEQAVNRILEIKERSQEKGLIVLVENDGRLNQCVKEVPSLAWDLIDMAEKPLTIIYPEAIGIAKNAVAPDGSVAIRMVKTDFCRQLIQRCGCPLISTSVNKTRQNPALKLEDVDPEIRKSVDFILEIPGMTELNNSPSSIIKLGYNGEIAIIRK